MGKVGIGDFGEIYSSYAAGCLDPAFCLLIETQAKIRLADEYDAAQARGEASKGRPKTLPEGKTFTIDEVAFDVGDDWGAK